MSLLASKLELKKSTRAADGGGQRVPNFLAIFARFSGPRDIHARSDDVVPRRLILGALSSPIGVSSLASRSAGDAEFGTYHVSGALLALGTFRYCAASLIS